MADSFFPNIRRNKTKMSTLASLFSVVFEVSVWAFRQSKMNLRHPNWKGTNKTISLHRLTLDIKNPKEYTCTHTANK